MKHNTIPAWLRMFGMLLICAPNTLFANPLVPGSPQTTPIALVGGTVHPVSKPSISQGTVLFENGRITSVGSDLQLPAGTRVVDTTGQHVYPGLFDAYTDLGLVEIGAVRATRDSAEVGSINPNVRALVAVNPDSELIPVARSGGILFALTAPQRGLLSGTSAVIQLDGWTYEDMQLKGDAALHIQWPRTVPVSSWWDQTPPTAQVAARDRQRREIREAMDAAQRYRLAKDPKSTTPPPLDARWESLLPVLEGARPVVIHADEVQQIRDAIAFADHYQLKLIILGGYDAPQCAEMLRTRDIPVIIAGVHRLPERRHEAYDAPFTLAKRLADAKVRFCIAGNQDGSNVRNLPYHAATASAYGLTDDQALKSITLFPAQVFGVADQIGSIEPGKRASLIVVEGDLLEATSKITAAYLNGSLVDLNDRHKQLWSKYQEKYRRQEKK